MGADEEDPPSSPTVADNSKDEDPCYEPEEPEEAVSDEQTGARKSTPSALGSILRRKKSQRSQSMTPAPETTVSIAQPPPAEPTAPVRGAVTVGAPLATRATVPGDGRATTPVATSTDPPPATPSHAATQVEQNGDASVKKRLRCTPGRTVSLLNVPQRPATRGAQAGKGKAARAAKSKPKQAPTNITDDDAALAAALHDEEDDDDFEPAPKKRNTRNSRPARRTTQRSRSNPERNVAHTPESEDDAHVMMKLGYPELRERINELEEELEAKEKEMNSEVAAMRDRCKKMVLMFKKQGETEKEKLSEELRVSQEALKRAEQALKEASAEASGKQDRVSPTRSLPSQAPETLACDVQQRSDTEAKAKRRETMFTKRALDEAVSAALDGAERRYKRRECEAQKRHEEIEHSLKARLLVAEVEQGPPAKAPTCSKGVQCAAAAAQHNAATQVSRRSPLRDALDVAASVAPVAGGGTDTESPVRISFVIMDPSKSGASASHVAGARSEKQMSAATEDMAGSKTESADAPSRPRMVDMGTQVETPSKTAETTSAHTQTVRVFKVNATTQATLEAPVASTSNEAAPMEGVQNTDQPPARKSVKIEDVADLSHLAELLSKAHAGDDVLLGEKAVPVPMRSSAGGEGWRDTAIWPEQAELSEEVSTSGLMSLNAHSDDQHIICVVSKGDTHITGGLFEMHGNVALVFDSSCSKLEVSGSTFTGGVIVCHGSGCSVTFKNVKLNGCTVVATGGAHVTLADCASNFDINLSQGISVFAHGAQTKVVMHNGTITGGSQGVAVQAGARVEACKMTISQIMVTGIEVKDQNSFLELSDCIMTQFRQRHSDLSMLCCVFVHAYARACLSCVLITRVVCGVRICEHAYATMSYSQIEHTKVQGIIFTQGGKGEVKHCTFSKSDTDSGVWVGKSCNVCMKYCKLLLNNGAGASVNGHGSLNTEHCVSISNHKCGFEATNQGVLKMTSCISELDKIGVRSSHSATLTVFKSHIMRSIELGLWVHDAATAIAKHLTISRSGHQGLVVANQGSKLTLNSSKVELSHRGCVLVCAGASATFKNTHMLHSETCAGVVSEGSGTHVEAENCQMRHNMKFGALAQVQSAMVVKNCITRGNQLEGYMAHTHARMTCIGCKSEGDRAGVGVVSGGMQMTDCSIDAAAPAPTAAAAAATARAGGAGASAAAVGSGRHSEGGSRGRSRHGPRPSPTASVANDAHLVSQSPTSKPHHA